MADETNIQPTIKRYYLQAPVLESASAFLAAHIARMPRLKSPPVVVLPSARSMRSVTELLRSKSPEFGAQGEEQNLIRFCTPGELFEVLFDTQSAARPELLARVWAAALEHQDSEAHGAQLPQSAARPLATLRDELSSAGLQCSTLLERHSSNMPEHVQTQFERLSEIELRYEELLAEGGYVDRWMARRAAWEERRWRRSGEDAPDVWIIGCAELSPFLQTVLTEYEGTLHVGIAAPQEYETAFNPLGVLTGTGGWEPGEFQFVKTNSLWEAAQRCITQLRPAPDAPPPRCALGIINRADRHLVTALLDSEGIPCRDGHGVSLSTTPPWIILNALIEFYTSKSADHLLALLAALGHYTSAENAAEAARDLDQFIVREVPLTVESLKTPGMHIAAPLIRALQEFSTGTKTAGQFHSELSALWSIPASGADAAAECAQALNELLPLFCSLPETTPLQALAATLAALGTRVHEPRGEPPPIELFGWLELYLDESPQIIVVNPTADLIPGPPPSNPFLPEALRREIGLPTQESRTQRDRYRWWYITHSKRDVTVLLQSNGSRGEPLLLSPCFMPIHDATRAAQLLLAEGSVEAQDPHRTPHLPPIGVLSPVQVSPPESVPVGGVGDYIVCPYRFALKHLVRLERIADSAHEFDALRFGTLLHSVLDAVVRSELQGREFRSEQELASFMEQSLDAELEFFEKRRGGALIQAESLNTRIAAYARWHLSWRFEGWRPVASEQPFSLSTPSGLSVRGRIDRVEKNNTSGETFLLDVKTSENDSSVEAFHRPAALNGKWRSLQLPLYRLGWMAAQGVTDLRLGLLFIDGAAHVTLREAQWTEHDFEDAQQALIAATNGIAAGTFWPPAEDLTLDPFPWINLFTVNSESSAETMRNMHSEART